MYATPARFARSRSRSIRRPVICIALLVAMASPSLVRAQTTPETVGKWSEVQPSEMAGVQVHMALVRDNGAPYHSRLVWWGAQSGHGGILGWRIDEQGCNSFPGNVLPNGNLIPIDTLGVTQNLFCGGQGMLPTGEVISVGGSDATLEGLRDALSYSATTGTWTTRTPMAQHRWYPTVTSLRDGRLLVVAGHKYDQAWFHGGKRGSQPPSVANGGHLLDRFARIPGGNWDPSVLTKAGDPLDDRPVPREGHSLVYMDTLKAPLMFGGRDSAGISVDAEVWYLTREDGGAMDPDYEYPWFELPVTGARPPVRSDHVALAASDSEMVVFGGVRRVGGGSETPLNDLWRLWKDPLTGWRWDPVTVNPSTPPSARFAHAAVLDTHTYVPAAEAAYLESRLIVFGGTTPGQPASDSKIYIFKFDTGTFESGTWLAPITLADGPRPRSDHTMTLTLHPWGTDNKRIAWMYGGQIDCTGCPRDTLWRLQLGATSATDIQWVPEILGGTPPGERVGHVAIHDRVIGKISIHGGSPGTTPDLRVYQFDVSLPSPGYDHTWRRSEPGTVSVSNHAAAFDPNALGPLSGYPQTFARIPEIFDPAGNGGAGSWTSLPAASRKPDYYPVQFLVPRTPFRADTCRVIEVGRDRPTRSLDIPTIGNGSGAGPWNTLGHGITGFDPDPDFNAIAGVMYRPGKILIAGGTTLAGPTNITATLDVAGTVGWVAAPSMTLPRYYINLVLLPTGGVMAMGGLKYADPNPKRYDSADAVLTPEYWEPGAADWFDYAATGAVVRNYHSTAILMPDGRVLTGGGWGGPPPGTDNPNWKRLQLFCPPYLFDASGNLATDRPVIDSAPATLTWRQRFTVCLDDTTGIRSACLIRPGATTHSVDMNQRFVPLDIAGRAVSPHRLFLTAPASPDSAPPGDYLLFVLRQRTDGSKVPSVARWVRVQATGDDLCDVVSPGTITDVAPEIIGPTEMWFTWTARADDGELSASGPASLFDLRGHTIPLDNSTAWNSALYQAQDESLPAELGSWGSGHIEGLLPCTSYHFGVRARDDHSQDGGFSSVSFQTSCDGGGSGYSAHQASGGEDGAGAAGTSPGPATTGGVAAPSSALSSTAYGSAAMASAGSLQPTTGLLVVETRREGVEGWRVTLTLREAPQGSAPPVATITVEPGGTGGEPDTLGRFEPAATDHVLGLCSLRERGRLGIPGVHRIERVMPRLKTRTGDHVLVAADHSRLGALGGGFIASGGGVEFVVGDSLVLIYIPAAEPLADAASWYVLVRRSGDAPPIPMGSRRGRVGETLPLQFALHQNRPNPFRGTTSIAFDLPAGSPVTLEVFDLLGRRVAVLTDANFPAGRHSVEWDLRDLSGTRVRPGVYAYRLSAGAFRERRKMNVLE